MEIKIGVQNVAREIVLESEEDADSVATPQLGVTHPNAVDPRSVAGVQIPYEERRRADFDDAVVT